VLVPGWMSDDQGKAKHTGVKGLPTSRLAKRESHVNATFSCPLFPVTSHPVTGFTHLKKAVLPAATSPTRQTLSVRGTAGAPVPEPRVAATAEPAREKTREMALGLGG
jgi:hypothetical protein